MALNQCAVKKLKTAMFEYFVPAMIEQFCGRSSRQQV